MAYDLLAELLEETEKWAMVEVVDQHPNLIDFLEFATYRRDGRAWWPTVIGWFVLYPLPLVAGVAWGVTLWWSGLRSCPYPWPWLRYVHYVNAVILAGVVIRGLVFLVRHFEGIRDALKRPRPKPQ